jgi:hypothetical protein
MILDTFGFVQLINACAGFGALEAGIHVHDDFKVVASLVSLWGIAWLTFIQNVGALSLLGECSTKMPTWNVVTWTTMISGHCTKWGQGHKALELF